MNPDWEIEGLAGRRAYQQRERELLKAVAPDVAAAIADEQTCREWGFSSLACPDGCWWTEADLCSACADVGATA